MTAIKQVAVMMYVEEGCRFIIGDNGNGQWCGLPEFDGSPYCPEHHAICHISSGSFAETCEIKRFERIAAVVGGKIAKSQSPCPTAEFMLALERRAKMSRAAS